MGKIGKILEKGPVEGQTTEVYPVTSTKAVYDENNKRLDNIITGLQESVYLNIPIPISTENTPESKAQNVKNIADYVEKAKAAGIANVDGIGVTCLIDGSYSGVGYLYGDTDTSICGIEIFDDSTSPMYFKVDPDGTYGEVAILMENNTDIVTSDMLVKGARKPIILTSSTTEVDEETYQKLLSNDVDVVFNMDDGSPLYLNFKESSGDGISLWFGYIGTAPISAEFPYGYSVIVQITVTISSATPHKLVLSEPSEVAYKPDEFIVKSDLIPVLQNIDLTGTDADRKAKLDQFEADWKKLTGASNLDGARFVGQITTPKGGFASVLFTYNAGIDTFTGVTNLDDSDYRDHYSVYLNGIGSLTITPLFSHLEAITIKSNNTTASKAANVAAINAYVDNLTALGVDTTKGFLIPINVEGQGSGFISRLRGTDSYMGIMTSYGIPTFGIAVSVAGEYYSYRYQTDSDNSLTTTSKQIVGAINEINANAVHSDKLVPTLEAITIKTNNSTTDKAANKAAIEAYRDNLIALGVDTTKGFMIPVKTALGDGFILFSGTVGVGYVKINNDCYGITIRADYGCDAINLMSTYTTYSSLETTSKKVLPAINEVNALVEKKADKSLNAKSLEAITIKTGNTPDDKAANVAAIKAYVDNLKLLGVDVTKGYMIPIRTSSLENIVGFIIPNMKDTGYVGLGEIANGHGINIYISNDGDFYNYVLQDQRDSNLTTSSKFIVSSINEVNALAKGYSTIFTPIELTTDPAQNKTAIDARVAAFTAQGISLTNGCCIPVTYKGVYAGNISLINGDWYGLLVKNTNNPADNINIKLSADGTITEGNSAQ